jgi:hypothetical protein
VSTVRSSNVGDTLNLHAEPPGPDPTTDSKLQRIGRRLRDARLIFVDEVTMMRADELDAIVAKLHERSFRGVLMIVGNCAQLGAVIRHADEATLIASSIVNASSFAAFHCIRHVGQMRMTDTELHNVIHAVGHGSRPCIHDGDHHTCDAQRVRLPVSIFPTVCATGTGLEQFRLRVHPDVADARLSGTIICSTSSRAKEHKLTFLDRVHGAIHTHTARDEVVPIRDGDQAFERAHISADAVREFNGSGIPPSELALKIGAPVLT